jgi:4-carboxymuconolactone decarboxylase
MDEAALRRGMKTRRRVLGDAYVDRAIEGTTPFNEDFQLLVTRYAWDEIWNRPHFDHRTRRLLTLAMTAALGRWEEFRIHVDAGLASGEVSAGDLKELLLQAAIYCGIPVANHGFREARGPVAAQAKAARKAKKAKKARR